MTTYKANPKPEHERVQLVGDQLTASTRTLDSRDVYEGKIEPLKVVTLPLDTPIYRMANGRTQTDQMAYIAAAKATSDFFSANEANASAQNEQHKILARFATEGSGSITPIYDELERSGQTEPILITRSGVVVNGNRRLAAMRELFSSGKHPNFANIDCQVLPPLTPDQIDEVEDRLQMAPETKLPYTWINEALRVRKRLAATGGKEEVLAHVMRRQPADIKKTISALNYVDIYLKDWKKQPCDYRLVEDGQQFFFDLPTRLRGKDGSLLEANMRMAWVLFDNRATLGGRIYDYNRIIGEKAADVLGKLADRIDLDDEEEDDAAPGSPSTVDDDLEIDFGEETATSDPYAPMIKALDDPTRREEITDELRRVCQSVIDLGKQKKIGDNAIVAVRDANTRLTEVDLPKADKKTFPAVVKQLEELIHRAEQLKAKVLEIEAVPPSAGPTD